RRPLGYRSWRPATSTAEPHAASPAPSTALDREHLRRAVVRLVCHDDCRGDRGQCAARVVRDQRRRYRGGVDGLRHDLADSPMALLKRRRASSSLVAPALSAGGWPQVGWESRRTRGDEEGGEAAHAERARPGGGGGA